MYRRRMFHLGREEAVPTCNFIVGCNYGCYRDGCWAKAMFDKLHEMGKFQKYAGNFNKPTFWPEVLNQKFRARKIYFMVSMGDIMGPWICDEWIQAGIEVARKNPQATFFFESKNPIRFLNFHFPENVILSTTIETNRGYRLSQAPSIDSRYEALVRLSSIGCKVHWSCEPIADFDLDILAPAIIDVKPWMIAVGYDSLNNGLPEPDLAKTMFLIQGLEDAGIKVERKLLREKIEMKGSWM